MAESDLAIWMDLKISLVSKGLITAFFEIICGLSTIFDKLININYVSWSVKLTSLQFLIIIERKYNINLTCKSRVDGGISGEIKLKIANGVISIWMNRVRCDWQKVIAKNEEESWCQNSSYTPLLIGWEGERL